MPLFLSLPALEKTISFNSSVTAYPHCRLAAVLYRFFAVSWVCSFAATGTGNPKMVWLKSIFFAFALEYWHYLVGLVCLAPRLHCHAAGQFGTDVASFCFLSKGKKILWLRNRFGGLDYKLAQHGIFAPQLGNCLPMAQSWQRAGGTSTNYSMV